VQQPAAAIIAATNLIPALHEKAGLHGPVLTFPDTDPLPALEAITRDRPPIVILERFFAATPRGVALIRRIQADPELAAVEIRVIAHDSDHVRVIAKRQSEAAPAPPAAGSSEAETAASAAPVLDPTGTRAARRFVVPDPVEAQVDGKAVTLVDISTAGAQVLSGAVLRPNQRVRLTLWSEQEAFRINANVEWSAFEMDRVTNQTRYRAGLRFGEGDALPLERFCERLAKAESGDSEKQG
jgi:hypothetical protein